MKNYRGGGTRFRQVVTAAAARTSGQAVVEDQFAGVAEVNAATSDRYALRRDGEFEFPLVATAAKGDVVFINRTAPFALTRAAAGTAAAIGVTVFGRVTGVPGNSNTGNATEEPKTGKMWVAVGPVEAQA